MTVEGGWKMCCGSGACMQVCEWTEIVCGESDSSVSHSYQRFLSALSDLLTPYSRCLREHSSCAVLFHCSPCAVLFQHSVHVQYSNLWSKEQGFVFGHSILYSDHW